MGKGDIKIIKKERKMKRKMKKVKVVGTWMLCLVLLCALVGAYPSNLVYATNYNWGDEVTVNDVKWSVSGSGGSPQIYFTYIKPKQEKQTELVFPTKKELYNLRNVSGPIMGIAFEECVTQEGTKYERCLQWSGADDLSAFSTIKVYEDFSKFPHNDQRVNTNNRIQGLDGNKSIKKVIVDTRKKNGFTIREATFYNMQGLTEVIIDVGSQQTIKLDGSVFANCPKLERVVLTGNVILDGSFNFAGCTNLKDFIVNGNITVNGSQDFAACTRLETFQIARYEEDDVVLEGNVNLKGSNMFTETTFSNAKNVKVSFAGKVNSKQMSDNIDSFYANDTDVAIKLADMRLVSLTPLEQSGIFTNCKNIDTISLNGDKNTLNTNFLNGVTVQNLNIEGSSTFDAGAISNSSITNVSFNQETKVENAAFVNDKIGNMYFNTSAVTGKLGSDSAVEHVFYNNTDINKNENKVTELANLSLDGVECENMYFFSPNFNYLKNVSYHNATKVFGYGGKIAKYEDDATKITSKDMFEKWVKKNGGTYENIVSLDESNLPKEKTLYVDKEGQSADLDLSSLTITAHYNPEVAEKDQFPTSVKSLIQASKYTLPYTTDADGDTNFSYKILQEVSSARVDSTTQYVYQGKNAKDEDATYVYCEDKNVSLQPGSYRYYVQAGGITWPLDVNVKVNAVERIEVQPKSGDVLHLTEGDNLDANEVKKRLIVTAYFANGEKQSKLDQSQFEIRTQDYKTEVSKTDTSLIVSYKSQGEGIKAICNYNKFIVHENKVVSFEVNSDKDVMADGSTLELKDISVKNVKYENPEQTPIGNVEKGFHFVQNGVIKDTYQITKGENKIAVVYEDCTMNDALEITGIDNAVEDFEVFCPIDEVELYKKNTLNVSEISLRNVEYKDSRLKNEEIIEKGFTFTVNGKETDTVELQEGKNVIGVKYNGLDKYSAITIEGIPTTIDRIEAQYIGPAVYEGCEVSKDTKVLMVTVYHKHPDSMDLLLSNFDVSYGTYHIVPGEDNQIYVYYKGVKSANAIHVQGLADNVVEFKKVTYKGSGKAGTVVNKSDFYVELGYASGKTVNSEQNPEILNQLLVEEKVLKNGENTIQLTYGETLTKTIMVNGTQDGLVTATPTMSVTTPAITSSPEQTPPATDNVVATKVPTGTNVPMEVPASPGLKEPVKGSYYTVQGVKYKVTAVKGKSGTVEAVGYDKKASKVKVQTTVKINGYSFAVQKIGKNAFKNCTKIAGTISFAKNIKTIDDSAFSGCKNIKKVIFGTNVTQIGKNSFYKCKKLQTIQFQSGSVKKIGKAAFKGIAKKYTLKCPKALQKTYKKRLKKAL